MLDDARMDAGKKPPPSSEECANCTIPGDQPGITLRPCSRCKLVRYCGTECQAQHWKSSHKKFCVAMDQRKPQPTSAKEVTGAKCTICLESMEEIESRKLLCLHVFHRRCIDDVLQNSAAQVCPLCRADILAGPEAGVRIAQRDAEEVKL